MPIERKKITPCLWFDTQAEEAANFYVSVFKNSKIKRVSRFTKEGTDVHGKQAGSCGADGDTDKIKVHVVRFSFVS